MLFTGEAVRVERAAKAAKRRVFESAEMLETEELQRKNADIRNTPALTYKDN
jgi:hypothetical protein